MRLARDLLLRLARATTSGLDAPPSERPGADDNRTDSDQPVAEIRCSSVGSSSLRVRGLPAARRRTALVNVRCRRRVVR